MGGALTLPPVPPLASGARIWVGFSGGCDSTVLLDLLRRAGCPGLRAVHVHHGLQAVADDWARHCRRVCRQWGVPLRVLRVKVIEDGHGPEAAARVARRAAIAALLRPGDLYVTAHHRDDQAETVLQRALRGTGIPGLGAMRDLEAFGTAQLWRPLLDIPQRRLREYADAAGLDWIEDPHNRDLRYTRVFLRRQVMPLLAAYFPSAATQLAKLAVHAQAAQGLLAELADEDAARCAEGDGLRVDALLALSPERRRNLLYHRWCALGLTPPSQSWYAELERSVLRARRDARPLLVCGDGEARRRRGLLYLMRRP
jgi:tRNA(Ile)-lysidine synthase